MGVDGYFINWENFLGNLELSDFLDVVTAVIRFSPEKRQNINGSLTVTSLLKFTRRVFSEQNLAYRIDERGGCHPFIDAAFSIQTESLIRSLSAKDLNQANLHISQAEKSLLSGSLDGRQAIRSTFDAAENLAKLIVNGATHLNKTLINDQIQKFMLSNGGGSRTEINATKKLVSSFAVWVEAGHFYRHASGSVEDDPPSESFAIAFVSQGFSFVRWIADAYVTSVEKKAPNKHTDKSCI